LNSEKIKPVALAIVVLYESVSGQSESLFGPNKYCPIVIQENCLDEFTFWFAPIIFFVVVQDNVEK